MKITQSIRSMVSRHNLRASRLGRSGTFTACEWVALCEQYENICLRCGASKSLTPDHIQPLAKGGTNSIDNIQPLCKPCNSVKSTSNMDYRHETKETRTTRWKALRELQPFHNNKLEAYALTWIMHSGEVVRIEVRKYYYRLHLPNKPIQQLFAFNDIIAAVGKENITKEQLLQLASLQKSFSKAHKIAPKTP